MKELVSFWLLTLVLVVIVLVSVLGNLLVCLAVKTDKNLRKLSNLFLVSLAIADLLVRMDDCFHLPTFLCVRLPFLLCHLLLLMILLESGPWVEKHARFG